MSISISIDEIKEDKMVVSYSKFGRL